MGSQSSVDIRQLYNLKARLDKLATVDSVKISEEAVKEIAQRMLATVVKRTPVGRKPMFKGENGNVLPKVAKVTGTSGKKAKMLTREGAILEAYWAGYVGGTLRRAWTVTSVVRSGDTFIIEVFNPIIYAQWVEYGHRQQVGRYVPAIGTRLTTPWVEGKFMMTLSAQKIDKQKDAIVRKIMKKHLEEAING